MTSRLSDAVILQSEDDSQSSPVYSARNIGGGLSVIAAVAILSSVLYILSFHDFLKPDSPSYVDSAANLASGHGFRDVNGYPETFRTPGYPLLIVPFLRFGLDLKYLIVLQHLFRLMIALSAAVFAYKLSNSRIQALIAGVLIC